MATTTVTILVLVLTFVFFPVAKVLGSAFLDKAGNLDLTLFWARLTAPDVWGMACFYTSASAAWCRTPSCSACSRA